MERELPDVEGVRHAFVDAGGLRTHVAEAGSGEPLVLVHGWPQNWYMWRRVIPTLARRYRVICPDLRGLGWTDAPPGGYGKEQLATDVLAVLDELGLERVRLAGHDWGGYVGFLICLREPARVERYLAFGIAPPFADASLRNVMQLWRFWYQWVIASPVAGERAVSTLASSQILRWIGGGPGVWSDEDREIFLGQLREPSRARASVQYYRSFQLREALPLAMGRYRRQRLRVPTRLLLGTRERVLTPSMLEGAERHADDLSVRIVDGAGHFMAEERPDLILDEALGFL